jgi:capsular polysaccharide export protein
MQNPEIGGWQRFAGKKILLLQGPHGPFFSRIARALLAAGARSVDKVNFNGGDCFFSGSGAYAYTGSLKNWPTYLNALIQKNDADCIMVFGDCRPIHVAARTLAQEKGITYWVFEEGYIRPNYITLEQHGVNGHSRLPSSRVVYDAWPHTAIPEVMDVPANFGAAARYAMLYFTASTVAWPWFWRYQHHRHMSVLDGLSWIRSYIRKLRYRAKEAYTLDDLKPNGGRDYFLVVLQVASDAQVTAHSPFESVSDFIADTVSSFARHALTDAVLLIKHHPMDRGYTDYSQLIAAMVKKHSLQDRVRYIHDQHLPSLLSHALGVVTINSTVGLSALFHGTPVITLSKAIYSMDGLTCQKKLEEFWQSPQDFKPDSMLHVKFRNYVTTHTQINGNFYVELADSDAAGLRSRVHPASNTVTVN